jgi:hypothetical protein
MKTSGKTSNPSPDLPNKKQKRSVQLISLIVNSFGLHVCRSDVQPIVPLKSTENGTVSMPRLSGNTVADPPVLFSPVDLKSAQIPFSENISVAAGIVGAQ